MPHDQERLLLPPEEEGVHEHPGLPPGQEFLQNCNLPRKAELFGCDPRGIEGAFEGA